MKENRIRKKILQVNIDNNGGNGAFTLVQYLYQFLMDEYIFDYFTMDKFLNNDIYKNIIKSGGQCYSANLRNNKLIGHLILPLVFYSYLKKNKYSIVHIHSEVAYKQFIYILAAKVARVPTVIVHSHSSEIDGKNKRVKYIFHTLFKPFVNIMGDYFIACSYPAAKWMFYKKVLQSTNYTILVNGILPDNYIFDEKKRNEIRHNLKVEDKIVLGHVGALKNVKNQERLIRILRDLENKKYVLLLVGDGENRSRLIDEARNLGVIDKVMFLGSRTDISNLLLAMDVFVFPSFFEGIPMALIEAQSIGLPIIASDSINKDVKINDNVYFLSLNESNKVWNMEIMRAVDEHMMMDGYRNIVKSKYNIKDSSRMLKAVYKKYENSNS